MPTERSQSENRPTVEDVARQAGVSTATVSRCLNQPDQVSARTQERVMEAVRQLGYAPNFGARALAAKRTNTFGAIVPTLENSIFARGLQAFQEELGRHGINLLVASSAYEPDLEADQIRALIARGADALLLIGYERMPATYAYLAQRKMPYAIAWAYEPTKEIPAVGFDNCAAMHALASRVIALGHRSLGLIGAAQRGNDRARARADGIRAAMRAQGLDPAGLRVVETRYTIADGRDAFLSLSKAHPEITAIFCGNDVLAAGALSMAQDLGLRVPEDISITGFDDIDLAEIVSPRLTTVHVPHRDMGRAAAQQLMALRNGAAGELSVALPTRIVWRESLGPAPRREGGTTP